MFVVDDFGRQRIPPRDLLNRWIVPLESRVDYLTLHTGRKFEVPFDVLIVFATNLKPESLADEAFLRRIPYKILAKNPTLDEYCRIFELNCRSASLAFDPVMVEYLDRKYYQPREPADARLPPARPARAGAWTCAATRTASRSITRELLDAACGSYFLDEQTEPSARRARDGTRCGDHRARREPVMATSRSARAILEPSARLREVPSRRKEAVAPPRHADAERIADVAGRAVIVVLFSLMAIAVRRTSSQPAASPGCCCSSARCWSSC